MYNLRIQSIGLFKVLYGNKTIYRNEKQKCVHFAILEKIL